MGCPCLLDFVHDMIFWSASSESTRNMNKFGQLLTIALALSAATTAVASACCTPTPVCADSISCDIHQLTGTIGVAATPSASVATPAEAPPHTGPVPGLKTIVQVELAQVALYLQHLVGL
jgi:hypothetical protein